MLGTTKMTKTTMMNNGVNVADDNDTMRDNSSGGSC